MESPDVHTEHGCSNGWRWCAWLALLSLAIGANLPGVEALAQATEESDSATSPTLGTEQATTQTAQNESAAKDEPAAQVEPTASPSSPGKPSSDLLPGEVGPDVSLLRDKQGRLQAVLGFSFEDFMEIYRLKNDLARIDERPRFVITRSEISGVLKNQVVLSSMVLTIELADSKWVRIPLGLTNSNVDEDAKLDGKGAVFIKCATPPVVGQDPDSASATTRAGYDLWLKGEPTKPLRVTIPFVTQVAKVGGETQLRLDAPRASVAHLVVDVPETDLRGRVSENVTLIESKAGADKTTFSVLGASGPVELSWQPKRSESTVSSTVLEASGLFWARIDGRSVNYEAKLNVRSFGGLFDTLRVRLPNGSQLVGNSQPGVRIVHSSASNDEKQMGELIEVKLDKKTSGPFELRLFAERPRTADNTDESIELAGFEVLGAVRQSGNIGIQVAGNWQVVWGESHAVRQIDEIPENLRREDLVAAYEYSAQPSSLTARVMPRRTRVSVQPRYVLTVGAHETRVDVELKYTIRGAKLRTLTLDMPGWEIDEIGPPNLVNVDAAAIEDSTRIEVPLAQPSNGDLTLTMTARRAMPGDGKPEASQLLEFDLPRPTAEVIAPAVVIIQPEDNVELTPRSDSLLGLSLRTSRPSLPLATLQQDPLFYQTDGAASKFVADFKVNAQEIVSSIESRIDMDEQEVQVEQHLRYEVLFEPVEKFLLRVPRTILQDTLEITLDGARLTLIPVREESDVEHRDSSRVSAILGGSRIGRCELIARYQLAQEKLPPATSVPASVPLVMPLDGRIKQNRALVRAESGISVSPRKGVWVSEEAPRGGNSKQLGLWLTATEPVDAVGLGITLQDRSREATTLVERAWIQTWLTERERQDRAVFRLTTSERRLRIGLPTGVNSNAVQAVLDGRAMPLETDARGAVTLALPTAGTEQRHLLELTYHLENRDAAGALDLEPPRLLPAVWSRRVYWQLILPGNEHLLVAPDGYTTESQWEWTGRYLRRTPTLDVGALEQWIGASTNATVTEASNSYLFSSLGEYPSLRIRTVRRASLVFGASFAVLLTGLALIYVPILRHPVCLFVAAVGALAMGTFAPDLAVIFGQAAVLGAVLIGLAVLLTRYAGRTEEVVRPAPAGERSSKTDRSATDLYYRAPSASSGPSTATAPMIVPEAEAESVS